MERLVYILGLAILTTAILVMTIPDSFMAILDGFMTIFDGFMAIFDGFVAILDGFMTIFNDFIEASRDTIARCYENMFYVIATSATGILLFFLIWYIARRIGPKFYVIKQHSGINWQLPFSLKWPYEITQRRSEADRLNDAQEELVACARDLSNSRKFIVVTTIMHGLQLDNLEHCQLLLGELVQAASTLTTEQQEQLRQQTWTGETILFGMRRSIIPRDSVTSQGFCGGRPWRGGGWGRNWDGYSTSGRNAEDGEPTSSQASRSGAI